MEKRLLGRTCLKVSLLGFGCGAVGGLMIRGTPAEQERAIGYAVDCGVNYFDTAASYGNGESERNLGRSLSSLGREVIVGTKVRLVPGDRLRIAEAVTDSIENSLRRLGREQVDLFQLHNEISESSGSDALDTVTIIEQVMPTFERLRSQGKTRFCGISCKGAPEAIHKVVSTWPIDTAQVIYNLLNPSAGTNVGARFAGQDFGLLLDCMEQRGIGVLAIRALAGGALSGTEDRDPRGSPEVVPMGSGPDYGTDVRKAAFFEPLVREAYATSLVDAALRFVGSERRIASVLVGFSTFDQLASAVTSINSGPLSSAALNMVAELHTPANRFRQ